MTNAYCSFLIAILITSSACLASTQNLSIATITGEIQSPTAREITFGYVFCETHSFFFQSSADIESGSIQILQHRLDGRQDPSLLGEN